VAHVPGRWWLVSKLLAVLPNRCRRNWRNSAARGDIDGRAARWLYPCRRPLKRTLRTDDDRLSLGVEGADEVLSGGLLPARSYVLRGGAGTGKTILGFHYLTAGVEAREDCLFVASEESADDIRELRITEGGLLVGDPPEEPRGVLTGAPEWDDDPQR